MLVRCRTGAGVLVTACADSAQFNHRADVGESGRAGGFDQCRIGVRDRFISQALGLGSYVLTGKFAFTQATQGVLPITDAATLGGLNNLSGLAFKQLVGSDMRYVGLRSEKIISQMPLGLRGDLRIGVSFEGGTMRQRYSETQGVDLVRSGSVDLVVLGTEILLER